MCEVHAICRKNCRAEAIEEGKTLKYTLNKILKMEIPLWVIVDSKYLHTTLSTTQNSIGKNIRAHVNVIRFHFDVRNVDHIVWFPRRINLTDTVTKLTSPLSEVLKNTLLTGHLKMDFTESEFNSYNLSFG